jgi:lysophospholipase L1-like esterase
MSVAVRERAVHAYVALGDSFTAGRGSVPGERWPDLLAEALRARNPSLSYRNLAVDGATTATVLDQVPAAVALGPDLVTVICGANDVLYRTRPDIAAHERDFDAILGRLRERIPEAVILTATAPDCWRFMELRPRTMARVTNALGELNAATRSVAARHRVPCLEVVGHPGMADPENFSADGLHPSALGHQRAAREFAHLLRANFGLLGDIEEGGA